MNDLLLSIPSKNLLFFLQIPVEADTEGEWVIGHTDKDFQGFGGPSGSPPGSPKMDDVSELSSQPPVQAPPEPVDATLIRSKSRTDMNGRSMKASKQAQKYNNLSFWKARKITFYKNGDAFYPGFEFIFKPGRDIATMEILLDKLTKKMDLPRGARFIYDMTGDKKVNLDDLEDGASYVVSAFKGFKVSGYLLLLLDHKNIKEVKKTSKNNWNFKFKLPTQTYLNIYNTRNEKIIVYNQYWKVERRKKHDWRVKGMKSAWK